MKAKKVAKTLHLLERGWFQLWSAWTAVEGGGRSFGTSPECFLLPQVLLSGCLCLDDTVFRSTRCNSVSAAEVSSVLLMGSIDSFKESSDAILWTQNAFQKPVNNLDGWWVNGRRNLIRLHSYLYYGKKGGLVGWVQQLSSVGHLRGHAKNSDSKVALCLWPSLIVKRKQAIAFLFLYVCVTWPQRPLALALGILISLYTYRFSLLQSTLLS
jgi:hypothetical protein